MVRVERHVDGIPVGDAVHVFGDRYRAEGHVLDEGAGCESGASGGDLDDPVAFAFRKPFQYCVGGGERGDVDGRIGEMVRPRPVEHLAKDRIVCYWHVSPFLEPNL